MRNLLRIASKLDEIGDFQLSDKIIKIAQAVLAPPQTTVKPTAILTPPIIAPISTCNLVTGIYAKDIMQMKQLIQNELNSRINPLSNNSTSMIFLTCIQTNKKYSKEQKLAFQNQSIRIETELLDSSKGKFYQIIYSFLKKYKVTENDLNLYRTKEAFTTQFGKMTDDLLRELSIPGLTDEFKKTNEYQFLFNTYSILIQRFNKI